MTSWTDIFKTAMGANVRPVGGIDMLHIDSDVNSDVDEAHEIDKQIKKMEKTLARLKAGFRSNGVGEQMGFASIAIVGKDVRVEDALNTKEVKDLIFDLVVDGKISKEQHIKCYKEPSTRKGSIKFEDRTD
tara:strand:- start:382 stop:774 length:393 start_codon:yes stop_codon:yes gene_type:complete